MCQKHQILFSRNIINIKLTVLKKFIEGLVHSAFLLLLCSGINFKVYSQKIQAESFNFSQLANRQAAQRRQPKEEHEIDGGWRYLQGNMPIPSGAKIMKQRLANTLAPNTPNSVESLSPPPFQSF